MGQCGCGDFSPDETYDLGNRTFIAVQMYDGCKECDTPAGIIIYRLTEEQLSEWGIEHTQQFPSGNYAPSEAAYPFIGRDELVKAARALEGDIDLADYSSLADLFQDWGLSLVQEALRGRGYKGGRVQP